VKLDSITLAIATAALNTTAQLLLRGAALKGATPAEPIALAKNPLFICALAAYAISVLTWLSVLKRVPLPVAMPFMALTYVLAPVAARFIYQDAINLRMAGGMTLIVSGIIIVAYK
jgi:drug/metabolite transporter (DMT)-like permease